MAYLIYGTCIVHGVGKGVLDIATGTRRMLSGVRRQDIITVTYNRLFSSAAQVRCFSCHHQYLRPIGKVRDITKRGDSLPPCPLPKGEETLTLFFVRRERHYVSSQADRPEIRATATTYIRLASWGTKSSF